jgi:hypothetical protein
VLKEQLWLDGWFVTLADFQAFVFRDESVIVASASTIVEGCAFLKKMMVSPTGVATLAES